MKKFSKWNGSGMYALFPTEKYSTLGTPFGKKGPDFREWMMDVEGFEPEAEAYVYVLVLKRQDDETVWYYVGETTDGEEGLESRIESHLRCNMSKPIRQDTIEVLKGKLPKKVDDSYVVLGVEQVEPISVEQEHLLEARTAERERQTAYEIAIEKEVTRVLGGV